MNFFLSTSYFHGRALSPQQMALETKKLGFQGVELGYFTSIADLPLWQTVLREEQLLCESIHAFCPMPKDLANLGPEAFSLATPVEAYRRLAVEAIRRSIACAKEVGAHVIVIHGGRVAMTKRRFFSNVPYYSQLSVAFQKHPAYLDEALIMEERQLREKGVPPLMEALSRSLEEVLPVCEDSSIILAFENLPGFEAFPDPAELCYLKQRFNSPSLGAWYDIGHGERKARVGDWPVQETLDLTLAFTAGMHIHDVAGLEQDHCAPGEGTIDFTTLRPLLSKSNAVHVFEPAPFVSEDALKIGLQRIQKMVEATYVRPDRP